MKPEERENYLKPLLLSIEYEQREILNTNFVEINKELHMDHILPKAFDSESDWGYVNSNEAFKYINTLGNMALLYYKKNEEALNKGFATKVNIYLGKNTDGSSNYSGATCFDTTKEVTEDFIKDGTKWDVAAIQRRYDTQINRIETMLEISEDMKESENFFLTNEVSFERKRAPRFDLFALGIKKGDRLFWYNDESIYCEVLDEHTVLYNGERNTLSGIAKDILNTKHVNGALYFKYNGEIISSIRNTLENS